jgi:hypothetical protein
MGLVSSNTRTMYLVSHSKKEIIGVPIRFPKRGDGLIRMLFTLLFGLIPDTVFKGKKAVEKAYAEGWTEEDLAKENSSIIFEADFTPDNHFAEGYVLKN